MYIDEWQLLQENANLAELELADGYYSNLHGKIVIREDDMKKLGLKEHTEIAISMSGEEMVVEEAEPPAVFLSANVIELSIKKGRNLWLNFADGVEYVDYLDIAIRFREFDAVGNLLMVKEHSNGMKLGIGDTLFLKIQRVITHS